MKKVKYLLFVIALLLMMPFAVHAEDKYFNVGDKVQDIGVITHSYFSAGYDVRNEMKIDGILFTAGNTVSLNGRSEYAFMAGYTINIDGFVDKDLFFAAKDVVIDERADLGRDVYGAASSIIIKTDINGNAFLTGDSVTIDSKNVTGNLNIEANQIKFADGLVISGTLKYNEEAQVTGLNGVKADKIETYKGETETEVKPIDRVRSILFSIISLIVVTYVINFFLPKAYKLKNECQAKEIFKRFGIGLLLLICIPIACIALLCTVIGVPLALLTVVSYIVMIYLSGSFTGKFIGELISKLFKFEKENVYLELALGIIIIRLCALIPYVGTFISALSLFYGLGYIFYLFKSLRTAKK
jgi:cytoskeletal protein CcmA (bactofilin family)